MCSQATVVHWQAREIVTIENEVKEFRNLKYNHLTMLFLLKYFQILHTSCINRHIFKKQGPCIHHHAKVILPFMFGRGSAEGDATSWQPVVFITWSFPKARSCHHGWILRLQIYYRNLAFQTHFCGWVCCC